METIFESERINYVRVDPNLINDYLKMINNKEIQSFIGLNNVTVTFDDEMEWVRKNMVNDSLVFSMIEKSTNKYIGNIEIMNVENNIGELGICITTDKQDNHFGQEAIKRILEYAYNDLKLNTVYLNVHGDNPRAIKCYERCNFVIDGEGKKPEDYHMTHKKEIE